MLRNVTFLGELHTEDKGMNIPESVLLNKVIVCASCYICVQMNLILGRIDCMSCTGLHVSRVTDITLF
jgi:hypothetical protein